LSQDLELAFAQGRDGTVGVHGCYC
jgi:hypothetical protein